MRYNMRSFFPVLMMTLAMSNGGNAEEENTINITPLPLLRVETHPDVHPLVEEETLADSTIDSATQGEEEETVVEGKSFSAYADDRIPLGFITASQDLQNQKWYLFAAAKRGMRNPGNVLEVISTNENEQTSFKGEAIKNLLVDMGISSEHIHVLSSKVDEVPEGEEPAEGKIYLFSKKAS